MPGRYGAAGRPARRSGPGQRVWFSSTDPSGMRSPAVVIQPMWALGGSACGRSPVLALHAVRVQVGAVGSVLGGCFLVVPQRRGLALARPQQAVEVCDAATAPPPATERASGVAVDVHHFGRLIGHLVYWPDNKCPDCGEHMDACGCDSEALAADAKVKLREALASLDQKPDSN